MSDVAQPLTKIKRLNKIISQHEGKITNLVPILQDVQAEYRYLPEEALSYVANALDVPPALVFGVSTFYSQFTMEPRGRYVIKVCDGTACHVRGSEKINFAIREAAGLGGTDAPTTSDLKFTVERVACVGACGLAPVVMVNDREVYGNLTQSEATQLVERLEKQDSSTDIDSPVIYDTEIGVVPEKKHFMQNHADLERAIGSFRAGIMAQKVRILVCMETACIANGAREVYAALRESLDARGLRAELGILSESIDTPADISGELNFAHNMPQPAGSGEAGLAKAGCHGYCQLAPLVVLEPGRIVYARVKPEDVPEIITRTVEQGEIISRLLNHEPGEEAPTLDELGMDFYRFQHKIALATCGRIDSEDIREYLAFGGYSALGKALAKQTPEEVLSAVNAAGLRGRGGGGFKTGIKWDACRRAPGDVKYVVCNADEGDPGAFMDRSLLEGDPHRVIEGIALCAYAIGAQEAYIYARAEYPLAVKRVKQALNEA
ncbi:MAG TPA: NAD(P)H-dependent oxidoreductase subunit E, partial [Candidatus Limnocylindrales bacterium]|nr:NAD(P)H-dependent oxidoreductase subunit E [Candidatus Limnocylindrales bacterium]